MLVYGDRTRRVSVTGALLDIAAATADAERQEGAARADLLERALIDGAGLAQGLIDQAFDRCGEDDLTPLHAAALDLTLALARQRLRDAPQGSALGAAVARLTALGPPTEVCAKVPEGFAYYGVYPQAYARAARSVRWEAAPFVIGIRSIGIALGAIAAAACGAEAFASVRPVGHPFARTVQLGDGLRAAVRAHGGPFAIVDEGPGLSGSSFGAVMDALEGLGVSSDRIVLFPSHPGEPGAEAGEQRRRRWRATRRVPADSARQTAVRRLFADLAGPDAAEEDLSAGGWRRLQAAPAPADPPREALKVRLCGPRGEHLAKFAGLGRFGEEKLARARALHAAGFCSEPRALRRGFILWRWEPGERLQPDERGGFLPHLARYIAFRAAAFPARPEDGASPEALCEMVRVNAGRELAPPPPMPSIHVDGRMHSWEWLRRRQGGYGKLDAVDHSTGHTLVGCQPAAWDVAGACIEFGLSAPERAGLLTQIEALGGPAISEAGLDFYETCYAAFQLGLWGLAEATAEVTAQRRRYSDWLGLTPRWAAASMALPVTPATRIG